ncbi:MAG: PolC-type DNA polymerase III [Peptococcaceae bacterium]|nr:PolC-type DNA polymerase III [Peptococcaceae bacterium]
MSETSLALLDAIDWQDFDPAIAGILRQANIKKVQLLKSQGKWIVYLDLAEIVDRAELSRLADDLRSLVPGIKYVEVIPSYHAWGGTLTELYHNHWSQVVAALAERLAALASVQYQIDGSKLRIATANEVSLQFLQAKGCTNLVPQYLRETFGLDVQVELVVNPDASRPEDILLQATATEQAMLAQIRREENVPATKEKPPGEAIFGRTFTSDAIPLQEVQDEERSVILQGQVFGFESRLLKSGRSLVIFNISDNTDSISVKIFDAEKGTLAQSGLIHDGMWVKVRGPVQYDKFSQELTLMARDIMPHSPQQRQDLAAEKRVELHLHTKMSTMDAIGGVTDLVKRAAKWGHPAVAITDHGVVQAFPEAVEAAQKAGIKLIYGVEAYLVDDDPALSIPIEKRKSRHCILLAKNSVGLYNLYQLITASHLQHFHRTPRMPRSLIQAHREGLIIGSACEAGELIRAYLDGADREKLKQIAGFYDYLEIQPVGNNKFLVKNGTFHSMEQLRDINRTVVSLGEDLGLPVVATGDVHFLDPEDEVYRRILMAGKGFEDADDQAPLYFKTTQEMLEEFSYLGEAKATEVVIANPRGIADQIEQLKPFPDELFSPVIPGAEQQIQDMTLSKAAELYGNPLPIVVQKRIDKELNSIIHNGFSVLYLIAHLLVKKSNEDGYLVGSRGSVGSSLVATFTGITEVNPLPPHYRCLNCKHNEFIEDGTYGSGADMPDKNCPSCGGVLAKDGHDIPFETFLGFKGDKVPDIDLNFSGDYQGRAHKFTEELFGKENVFRAGTIATIADKTAFGFVKNYLEERGIKVRTAHMTRLVNGCTGVKRTTGQHPGGLMVIPKECRVHDFTPLQRPADDVKSDTITTHFDYHSISGRLVKLDILGHDDPTVIKMLEDLTGVDAKQIPLDEPQVMSLFSSPQALGVLPEDINSVTGTFGIPEFGTKFVRQMLEDTQPRTFSDLVRISGLSHGTDVWLGNAQDLVRSGTANIADIIACRDDIMVYLIYKGLEPSKAFKIMEGVRKGKGVKEEDIAEMRANAVPEWYIDSCLKIKYMFPKAHAVAYVTMAFRIAWFKVYHPEAFYATFFTVRADEFDADLITQGLHACKRRIEEIERKGNEASAKEKNLVTILELAVEMYCRKIKLLRVDLQNSDATSFKICADGIQPPFASLQGLGSTAAGSIVAARQDEPFQSIEDLRVRARLSKTIIDIMNVHGCLQGLPDTNQMSLF